MNIDYINSYEPLNDDIPFCFARYKLVTDKIQDGSVTRT